MNGLIAAHVAQLEARLADTISSNNALHEMIRSQIARIHELEMELTWAQKKVA